MILKTLSAKALLGAGIFTVGAGSVAAVGLPMANAAAATPTSQAQTKAPKASRDALGGMVISVSDKRDSMVVEVTRRDATTKAVTKDDATIFLTNTTKVFKWGDKDHQVGLDAITKSERVRVRYTVRDGNKYANRVVLLPDVRAGRVLEKGTDSFTIKTREGRTLTISVTDATKYWNVVKPKDRQPGSFAALKAGDRVRVLGETDKNGTSFDGAVVAYHEPAK